jgi:hypothetical protein
MHAKPDLPKMSKDATGSPKLYGRKNTVVCEKRSPKFNTSKVQHKPRIAGGQEMTYGRSLERHLKYFGLVDDCGKAITFSK